ncbi:MAG: signal peptidase I [Candidatus Omnitrophica bacterium]|nr:signal peptidase I [Candidatus Omnitrophota bacterium]MCF7877805.1 signal peptidase I [Candidatus Omnitrophota bacterium]MCF7891550.1 signal peptidase I [Candidatus Omnitrophota bacterium]MCF7897338.1 signal peptidase I [Candidatus Omnitrophota bacterium]MCF7909692.1 signal peptidase I [Candidatus Omnitrophota bacterium]
MKKKSSTREWIESIVVAALLVVVLKTFFFQMYKIPTTSMVPTLKPKDKIFVSKLSYGPKMPFNLGRLPGFADPERGDVIVFIPPQEVKQPWYRRKPYIKRVVGLPGETIEINKGNIQINGEEVIMPEVAAFFYYNQGEYARTGKKVVVPEKKYFCLGDNSISSKDSRYWGFVDKEQIIGEAIFIWWPPKRIGMIE